MLMQRNISIFIQVLCIVLLITSFSLPWIEKGFISVSGFKVPLVNEAMMRVTNILYVFTPSKKSAAQIGYVFYLVPMLSIMAGVSLIFRRITLSKYILFLAAMMGTAFSIYFYSSLSMSFIGMGPHLLLLTSLLYIIVFFTPLIRKKKTAEIIPDNTEIEKSETQEPTTDFLD